ncbi:interferon regulatory factor 9 isoform X2 [Denticeps clupeoides]|uniref:IRF tryptophan pentad repeat domain-containing protein n=1 Tax=Denticeps clupeoides TaxID=299321 RepID=A0AAY3ZXG4_9TELE|nr:interferon regulatory factor 9 isoform X2 [Denticeps clupeoides]
MTPAWRCALAPPAGSRSAFSDVTWFLGKGASFSARRRRAEKAGASCGAAELRRRRTPQLPTGIMLPVKIRSTRRLRTWMVDQVNSGKYPGLVWDDPEKTMFRIPWKHAGKQDFRSDEDAAIFKAWAEFKGKPSDEGPASWKTRLRCALNKSPEFSEVDERSQMDISEPYKVYRLVPLQEQGVMDSAAQVKHKCAERGRRKRKLSDGEEAVPTRVVKREVPAVTTASPEACDEEDGTINVVSSQTADVVESSVLLNGEEIQLNVTIETIPPPLEALSSFLVTVLYVGQEVLQREIQGSDVRISYLPSSPIPPSPPTLNSGTFPRIALPDPPTSMASDPSRASCVQAINSLLPYIEKGVVLTSTSTGVYAKRFCHGRVFWRGPHTGPNNSGLNKLERDMDPVMLFNKETFRQELEHFQTYGGEPPQSAIILCFGQELLDTDEASSKLIIIKLTLPWAERQVQDAQVMREPWQVLQNLASQSALGEVTLNLVEVN